MTTSLKVINPETKPRFLYVQQPLFIPHPQEPSLGTDRTLLPVSVRKMENNARWKSGSIQRNKEHWKW